jgi:bacteriocin-associated integral membrane protein
VKKLSVLFLIFAYLFSFYVLFLQTDAAEFEKITNLEKKIGKEFIIQDAPFLSVPEEIYPLLCATANECGANIFRTGLNYREGDAVELKKFIYLTGDTDYFADITLKAGRFLSRDDDEKTAAFLSSINTEDAAQVGLLQDFAGNHDISIKPLWAAYEYFPVYGTYYIEIYGEHTVEEFAHAFAARINEEYAEYALDYTAEDFMPESGNPETSGVAFSWLTVLRYVSYVVYIIAGILLIYYILNESKRMGILKLHGLSTSRLWFIMAGKPITWAGIFTTGIVFFCALVTIQNTTTAFMYHAAFNQLKVWLLLLFISLIISYVYILQMRPGRVLKNSKDITSVFVLNLIVKALCSLLIISLGVTTWLQYADIQKQKINLKNWENMKDYAVFYPVTSGYDATNIFGSDSLWEFTSHNELYFYLNEQGAILANTKQYEEQYLALNANWQGIRSIKVNNNYLQAFPVLDIHDQPVQVAEDTSDWVILAAEKYQDKEELIRDFFLSLRRERQETDQTFYRQTIPEPILNQEIVIIWLKNEQRLFSFNPKVFPANGNLITDPIIEVITESNSLFADRDAILGGGGSDPLKVKLVDRDSSVTYKLLEPELKELKVDDNLRHLITIDQQILENIYRISTAIQETLLMILALLCGWLVLMIQNLIIFFNKYQRPFVVRRLFGLGFIRTYKEFWLLFLMTWSVLTIIAYIMNKGTGIGAVAVIAIVWIVEIVTSIAALMVIERKNKIRIIKGGN